MDNYIFNKKGEAKHITDFFCYGMPEGHLSALKHAEAELLFEHLVVPKLDYGIRDVWGDGYIKYNEDSRAYYITKGEPWDILFGEYVIENLFCAGGIEVVAMPYFDPTKNVNLFAFVIREGDYGLLSAGEGLEDFERELFTVTNHPEAKQCMILCKEIVAHNLNDMIVLWLRTVAEVIEWSDNLNREYTNVFTIRTE